jgi:hypothetical protein
MTISTYNNRWGRDTPQYGSQNLGIFYEMVDNTGGWAPGIPKITGPEGSFDLTPDQQALIYQTTFGSYEEQDNFYQELYNQVSGSTPETQATEAAAAQTPAPTGTTTATSQNSSYSYQQAIADQLAQQERMAGISSRDQLYGEYLDAAESATNYVNAEIERERQNAALLGIEYSMTDEQKKERIDNYFASIWGEGSQAQLQGLFDRWGAPQGFSGWTVARGANPETEIKPEGGLGQTISTSTGIRPKQTQDEDSLGGTSTLLGG